MDAPLNRPFLADVTVLGLFPGQGGALEAAGVAKAIARQHDTIMDGMRVRINGWEAPADTGLCAEDAPLEPLYQKVRPPALPKCCELAVDADVLMLRIPEEQDLGATEWTQALERLSAIKASMSPQPYVVLLASDVAHLAYGTEATVFDEVRCFDLQFRLAPASFVRQFYTQKCGRDYGRSKIALDDDITVLFADVEAYAYRILATPRYRYVEIANRLDQVLTRICKIVRSHQGNVEKFIGDAVMATFTDTGESRNTAVQPHRRRCLDAALQTKRDLAPLGGWLTLNMGVASGPVLRGPFGPPWCHDFTVIGVAVNEAARIQSKAHGGRVLVSHTTWEQLDAQGTPRPEMEGLRWIGRETTRKVKRESYRYRELDCR